MIWKYASSEVIPFIKNDGIFRFGRSKYYRLLQAANGDNTVGDFNESKLNSKVEYLRNGFGQFVNCTFVTKSDCYIFCCSRSDNFSVMGYNGRVEITSPEDFSNAIYNFGKINGEYIRDNCSMCYGSVNYTGNTVNYLESSHDPEFVKTPEYYYQEEFRFVLKPNKTQPPHIMHLDVICPEALDFIGRSETITSLIADPYTPKSADECKANLQYEFYKICRDFECLNMGDSLIPRSMHYSIRPKFDRILSAYFDLCRAGGFENYYDRGMEDLLLTPNPFNIALCKLEKYLVRHGLIDNDQRVASRWYQPSSSTSQ